MRKRSYFLLEVLVAMGLVALCLFPLLQMEWSILKGERLEKKNFSLEGGIRKHCVDTLEKIYQRKLSLRELIHQGSLEEASTKRKTTFSIKSYKEKEGNSPCGLLEFRYLTDSPPKERVFTFYYLRVKES